MSDPILLRVLRPYSSADEYLAAEAWTIQSRTMLLIGEPPQPAGAAVRFDIVLGNGEKVIRAEGSVVRHLAAAGDRPGGLEVRFRRFGGATKGFIDRVLSERGKKRAARLSTRPELASIPDVAAETPPKTSSPELPERVPVAHGQSALTSDPGTAPLASNPDAAATAVSPGGGGQSALRRRRAAPVAAPPHRELLLERLRERARGLRKAGAPPEGDSGHRQYGR